MHLRLSHFVLATTVAAGCGRAPNAMPALYALRDTVAWECGGNGGHFATLYHGTDFVDSIDLGTGFQVVPQGLIITPVRLEDGGAGDKVVCPQDPIVLQGKNRLPLQQLLPYFDPHFPTRALLDSSILYWGFVGTRAYAARFSLVSRAIDTTFVVDDSSLFETDNSFQFLPPIRVDSGYLYETATGLRFTLNRAFRVIANAR